MNDGTQQHIQNLRAGARANWERDGWPSQRLEAWRNTSLRTAKSAASKSTADENTADENTADENTADENTVGAPRFNGAQSDAVLSSFANKRDGLRVERLGSQLDDPSVLPWLGKIAPSDGPQNALINRNTAFFAGGILVVAGRGAVVTEPVELNFSGISASAPDALQRLLVVAEENSELTVIMTFSGDSDRYVRNIVAEVVIRPGATVRCIWLQDEPRNSFHLATFAADVQRDARLECHVVQIGAALGRFDAHVRLRDRGASCQLNGLYHGDGRQHLDCNIEVHHDAGHTDSDMLFKGILDDHSTGVFRGNVLIHDGASKSTSSQMNRNLLLSDNATANSKPQLEIDNDDVRASHGTTIGQLDEEALFYMQSRGITADVARRLMIAGFADEVLRRLPSEAIRKRLTKRFAV